MNMFSYALMHRDAVTCNLNGKIHFVVDLKRHTDEVILISGGPHVTLHGSSNLDRAVALPIQITLLAGHLALSP